MYDTDEQVSEGPSRARMAMAQEQANQDRPSTMGAPVNHYAATGGKLQPANYGLEGYSSQELSLDNIEDAMKYQPWGPSEKECGDRVGEALLAAAKAILRSVPRSPRRTLALQHLVSARMDANCAISFRGRF